VALTLPSTTRSTRYRPILAAVLVVVAGLLLSGNRHISGARGATSGSAAGSVLLGVTEDGVPSDMAGLHAFEQDAGKQAAIVNWYWSWQDTLNQGGPDLQLLRPISDRGSVPMISWAPQDYYYGVEQPNYNLGVIASGRYDSYVRQWGERLAAYGQPVLLRWAWEMNGNWMPWGMGVNGNTPEQYVAAWRHLHDLFAAAGASNVQWVWSPNIVVQHELPLESLFPGDGYVDWLALDGYNRVSDGWQSFTDIFYDSYVRITSISTKPVMIAETSSSEAESGSDNSKAQWITSALTIEIPTYFPRVYALVWFNVNKTEIETNGYDWRIESSTDSVHAFAGAVTEAPIGDGRSP